MPSGSGLEGKIASIGQRRCQVTQEAKEGIRKERKGSIASSRERNRNQTFCPETKRRLATLRTKLGALVAEEKYRVGGSLSRFAPPLPKKIFLGRRDTLLKRTGRRIGARGAQEPVLCGRVAGQNRREPLLPSHGIHGREPIGFTAVAAGGMGEHEPIPPSYKRVLAPAARRRSFRRSPPAGRQSHEPRGRNSSGSRRDLAWATAWSGSARASGWLPSVSPQPVSLLRRLFPSRS